MVRLLKVMNSDQLLELFEDIQDSRTLINIRAVLDIYLKALFKHERDTEPLGCWGNDEADLKTADDLQRYNDIKAEQEGR